MTMKTDGMDTAKIGLSTNKNILKVKSGLVW